MCADEQPLTPPHELQIFAGKHRRRNAKQRGRLTEVFAPTQTDAKGKKGWESLHGSERVKVKEGVETGSIHSQMNKRAMALLTSASAGGQIWPLI